MPSPFPGMNPYLEQEDAWHDFHESFMPRARDAIIAQVDPRYIVKIDEHVFIQAPAVDIERLAFLEIRDRRNRQLVTVIELLSPANKRPGGDRDQYLAKRQKVLASTAHLVEIDLLPRSAVVARRRCVGEAACRYGVTRSIMNTPLSATRNSGR